MNRFNYFGAEFVSWLAMNALISVVIVLVLMYLSISSFVAYTVANNVHQNFYIKSAIRQ